MHPAGESDAGGRHQSEDLARRASTRGRGVSLDRIAERGARVLHRLRRQIAERVPLPRAAAVIREPAGAAGDGEGALGFGFSGADRDDRYRVGRGGSMNQKLFTTETQRSQRGFSVSSVSLWFNAFREVRNA